MEKSRGAFPRFEEALVEGAMTPERLAVVLGIDLDVLEHVRSGLLNADTELKRRIAAVLDVPVEDLFVRSPTTVRLLGSSGPPTTDQYRTITAITRRAS